MTIAKVLKKENEKQAAPDQSEVEEVVIPVIIGDGIGIDVTPTAMKVVDAAVSKAYSGKRKIIWKEILAGEKAKEKTGEWLPKETFDGIKKHKIALKGPLTTPIGEGIRSLNVSIRQELDLFACVRPVRHFAQVPSPVKDPGKLDIVIFRENTEDVYAGIEWKQGSEEAQEMIAVLKKLGKNVSEESAIGIKPISKRASKRLVRAAIQYAIDRKRKSVTLMHKGNIMKFTEGAFMNWGYEVAKQEFPEETIAEQEIWEGKKPEGRIIIKDRIADSMFQQILLRPEEYDVIATTNLNGDFISDAAAAQVGGIGLAPGANINYESGIAVFEATHGTAPKYAGQDKVNPGSIILSAVMMLEFMRWQEAADLIIDALTETFKQKKVTYDLARLMEGAELVSCSGFGSAVIENMG